MKLSDKFTLYTGGRAIALTASQVKLPTLETERSKTAKSDIEHPPSAWARSNGEGFQVEYLPNTKRWIFMLRQGDAVTSVSRKTFASRAIAKRKAEKALGWEPVKE